MRIDCWDHYYFNFTVPVTAYILYLRVLCMSAYLYFFILLFYTLSSRMQSKIVRVLNLWQKNEVLPTEVIQPLMDLAKDPQNPVVFQNGTSVRHLANHANRNSFVCCLMALVFLGKVSACWSLLHVKRMKRMVSSAECANSL